MPESSQTVRLDHRDSVATITFDRPDRFNALNMPVATAFLGAVERALDDSSTRVIVLRGEGRAFGVGGDLAYFHAAADKRLAAGQLIEPMHDALARLAAAPQIVVGSVHGAVAGAAMSIALGCDLCVAADNTSFNFAYGDIGAAPDCGGSWALPRLVGTRRALEIALLSEPVLAAQALVWGLVNRVVPLDQLSAETTAIAERLANGPSAAFASMKHLLRSAHEQGYAAQLALEARDFAGCAQTDDFAEGLQAFFDKRPAQFTGH